MKILIATDTYIPYVNGVITSIVNLKSGLELKGHEVRIITLSDTVHSHKDNDIYYFGAQSTEKVYPGARRKILGSHKQRKELLEWKPDIIHTQVEFSSFYVARKLSAKGVIPMIHTYHTLYEDYTHYFSQNKKLGVFGVKFLLRYVVSNIEALIVPTKKIYKIIDSYKLGCPLKILPTGITLDKFSIDLSTFNKEQFKLDLGIKKDQFVLLFVGRITKEKNILEIVTYLKNSSKKDILLLVVGDGPERKNIENYIKNSTISGSINFTGMIDPNDVPKYYAIADLFVSGSMSETQGLTYIEALAAGKPLLCRQDECLEELLEEGKNGYSYTNEHEFFEKLEKLQDVNTLQKMSEYAKISATKFSKETFTNEMELFYKEIISNHNAVKLNKIKKIVKTLNSVLVGFVLWIITGFIYVRAFFFLFRKKK